MDRNNSEINLNLKIPPEEQGGGFSLRELVLTLHGAKKMLTACCAAGLILGMLAGVLYFITASLKTGEASVTLTLSYRGAELGLFPNGDAFDARSFYTPEIWEKALEEAGRGDVAIADAMNSVIVTRPRVNEEEGPELLENICYIFTIAHNDKLFKTDAEKEKFLQALCGEYKNYIIENYYVSDNAGTLYGQQMRAWLEASLPVIWDPLSFDVNLTAIDKRYRRLAQILDSMFFSDPAYRTEYGMSFDDYARELRDICDRDIAGWSAKLNYSVYIRNVDQFKVELPHYLNSLTAERDYYRDRFASYNSTLDAFQQKDSQGVKIDEAVSLLTQARACAERAAELQKQISRMEKNSEALAADEQKVRADSLEAETALTAFISDLERDQETLRGVIYDYYIMLNERDTGHSVIYTNTSITTENLEGAKGASLTQALLLLIGLTFAGFAAGFCAAFVRKYLPEKKLAE